VYLARIKKTKTHKSRYSVIMRVFSLNLLFIKNSINSILMRKSNGIDAGYDNK